MDTRQDKIIDQVFREGLEEGPITPSADLWDRIEYGVAQKPSRKGFVFFWKGWAVAATVAFLLSLGYNIYQGQNGGAEILTENTLPNQTTSGGALEPNDLNDAQGSLAENGGQLEDATTSKKLGAQSKATLNSTGLSTSNSENQSENTLANSEVKLPSERPPIVKSERSARSLKINSVAHTGGNGSASDNSITAIPPTNKGAFDKIIAPSGAQNSGVGDSGNPQNRSIIDNDAKAFAAIDPLPFNISIERPSPEIKKREVNRLPYAILMDDGDWEDGTENREVAALTLGGFYGPGYANANSGGLSTNAALDNRYSNQESLDLSESNSTPEITSAYSTGVYFGMPLGKKKRFNLVSGLAYAGIGGTPIGATTSDASFANPTTVAQGTNPIGPSADLGSPGSNVAIEQNIGQSANFVQLEQNGSNNIPFNGGDPGIESVQDEALASTSGDAFSYRYVEIPLMLSYNIIDKRMKYFVSSGFSANLLSTLKVGENGSPQSTPGPTQMNLLMSTGVEYGIRKTLSIRMAPLFRYGLFSRNELLGNRAFNSFGFNTGLNFHF